MHWLIIFAFLIVLGLNILAIRLPNRPLVYVTKPLLTILLLVFYILKADQIEMVVVMALLAGLAGDVFLMLPDRNVFFLAGLLSFLAGHLFYILAFIKASDNLSGLGYWFYLLSIPYLVAGLAIFISLKPYSGKLTPCVAGYVLTIICMGILSLTSIKSAQNLAFLFPVLGGILFIISDTCLAFAKFKKVKSRDGIVMLTYGLAQLFLTVWFTL